MKSGAFLSELHQLNLNKLDLERPNLDVLSGGRAPYNYVTAGSVLAPLSTYDIPANTRHRPNVGPMLGQRLRRWPNIGPTLLG